MKTPLERIALLREKTATPGKVLDLLAFVFDRHTETLNYAGDQRPLGICDYYPGRWPCAEYTVALAALDKLDGGSTSSTPRKVVDEDPASRKHTFNDDDPEYLVDRPATDGGVPVAGVEETSTPAKASSPSDDGASVPGGTRTSVAALDAATVEPAPSSSPPPRIRSEDIGPDGLTGEERSAGLAPLFGLPEIIDTATETPTPPPTDVATDYQWGDSGTCGDVDCIDCCPTVATQTGGVDWEVQANSGIGFPLALHREQLIEVLIHHQRRDVGKCLCGFDKWGYSHAQHVADVVLATAVDLDSDDMIARIRLAISDPSSVMKRNLDTYESVAEWSTRAVRQVMRDFAGGER